MRVFIEEKSLISFNQWGFCHGKSTSSALAYTVHFWNEKLQNGYDICSVFFDLKKAFDRVPHRQLLEKLANLHLPIPLLKWLSDYLSNRYQQVKVEETKSTLLPVLSGVPQGSLLGPYLFILYINDIFSLKLSSGSLLTVYADDICYSMPVATNECFEDVQKDIDLITNWITSNCLTINENKSVWMLISKKHQPVTATLYIGTSQLKRVSEVKYLGVLIAQNLSWENHIQSVVCKAKQKLGVLYRTFYKQCSVEVLRKLYISLIRPGLEYCCIVWDPSTKRLVEELERVQKFATKICLKQWHMTHYEEMLQTLNIPSLQFRRSYMKLVFLFKVMNDLVYFPSGIFVYHNSTVPTRSYNPLLLQAYFSRTNYFMFSFVPHTIYLWSSLPPDVTGSPTLSSFKKALVSVL